MGKTIGTLHWDACSNCKHSPEEGGCSLDMPDDLNNFVLNFDYIECPRYEGATTK